MQLRLEIWQVVIGVSSQWPLLVLVVVMIVQSQVISMRLTVGGVREWVVVVVMMMIAGGGVEKVQFGFSGTPLVLDR